MKSSIDFKKCKTAFTSVHVFLAIWAAPMALIICSRVICSRGLAFFPLPSPYYEFAFAIHLVGAAGLLVSLGILAKLSQRSGVHFGLLPLFLPIAGPLIAYAIIRRIGKEVGWL